MEKETMLGKVVVTISGLPLEVLRVLYDLLEKLISAAGREWLAELKRFLRKEPCWKIKKHLNFSGKTFTIPACDGSKGLVDVKEVVFDIFDLGIENQNADERGRPTGQISVEVGDLVERGKFVKIFGSLIGASPDNMEINEFVVKFHDKLEKIFQLTPHQVNIFIKNNKKWIRSASKDRWVFIPYKSNGEFFIASAANHDGRFRVCVNRLEYDYVWYAMPCRHFIVPQSDI